MTDRPGRRHLRPFAGPFFYVCCALCAGVLLAVAPAAAAEGSPWHIVADELSYDQAAGEYVARGQVRISKAERQLTADFVRFNHRTLDVSATGGVRLETPAGHLSGSRVEINLRTETGTLYDSTVFLKASHFYIRGRKIEKLGPDVYAAEAASVTACDGERPDWKLTGRRLRVTIEGYGFVDHAALWARDVPVLYTPWLAFPVKLTRQTGLLPPQVQYSDRRGAEYLQPFFWALSPSADATVYADYMERRGTRGGVEYRWVSAPDARGTLMADGFNDRRQDDGSPAASRAWGYPEDAAARPNTDRYWFRAKIDQPLPHAITARLDLDVVSDQDYLHEFRGGYMGFDASRAAFANHFGRDLDPYDDPVRLNRLNLARRWSAFSLNAETRWYDDVVKRRQMDADDTLHKLPWIAFSALKQPLPDTRLYYDLGSGYTHFYRTDGERGHRFDVHPRLYAPLRVADAVTLEPSVGLRGTAWHLDAQEGGDSADRTQTRGLYDLSLDLATALFKDWPVAGGRADRLRHTLRPRVTYTFIPDVDQDEHPAFDPADRVERANRVTYALTNTLTARLRPPAADHPGTAAGGAYRTLLRLKLEQSYDFNEAREDDPSRWANGRTREPFSPLRGELEVYLHDLFSVSADAAWSTYDNTFVTHNVAARLQDRRGDHLQVEHRYQDDLSESLHLDLGLRLAARLALTAEYERNLFNGENIRTAVGLLYRAACWSAEVTFSDEAGDTQYQAMLNLYGFESLGD